MNKSKKTVTIVVEVTESKGPPKRERKRFQKQTGLSKEAWMTGITASAFLVAKLSMLVSTWLAVL